MVKITGDIDESGMVNAPRRANQIGSENCDAFDRLARLAAVLLKVPVALISLFDANAQHLKGRTGVTEPLATRRQIGRGEGYCPLVAESGDSVVINNSTITDLGLEPWILEGSMVRAFAGIPLRTADGQCVGAFCVIDWQSRTWQPGEIGFLSELATCAMTELDLIQARQENVTFREQLCRRQKLEAIGHLAAGMVHEFNNVLTAITTNAHLATQMVDRAHPAHEPVLEIARAGMRARDLVSGTLRVAGVQPGARRRVALDQIIEESARLFRVSLPNHIDLIVHAPSDTPAVTANPGQVGQVLLNLMTNARHAMENRTGRISILLDTATIDAQDENDSSLPPGSYARIHVSDGGNGIDPTIQDRIFEPFFTTKAAGEGTGLGLAVVREIMQAHDGAVRLRSTPGLGSTFTLWFPVPTVDAGNDGEIPAEAPDKGERILYLDDEASLVSGVTRALTKHGFQTCGATTIAEGLSAANQSCEPIDAVIVDVHLRDGDGFQFAREMRQRHPEIPLILTTGHLTAELRDKADAAGFDQILRKPATIEELVAIVRAALASKRNLQKL